MADSTRVLANRQRRLSDAWNFQRPPEGRRVFPIAVPNRGVVAEQKLSILLRPGHSHRRVLSNSHVSSRLRANLQQGYVALLGTL